MNDQAMTFEEPLWTLVLVIGIFWTIKMFFKLLRESRERKEEQARKENIERMYFKLLERLNELCDRHDQALTRKARHGCYKDDYGILKTDEWHKDVAYFVEHVLKKDIVMLSIFSEAEKRDIYGVKQLWFDDLAYNDILDRYIDKIESDSSTVDWNGLTAYEYEKTCAQVLCEYGWKAAATQASADQGADVIAQKDGIVVVLQCKLYNQPVGNKAVQEVHAAKVHYGAHYAAVVSNNVYTPSARKLARSTHVLLLHHEDLRNLEDMIDPVTLPAGSA